MIVALLIKAAVRSATAACLGSPSKPANVDYAQLPTKSCCPPRNTALRARTAVPTSEKTAATFYFEYETRRPINPPPSAQSPTTSACLSKPRIKPFYTQHQHQIFLHIVRAIYGSPLMYGEKAHKTATTNTTLLWCPVADTDPRGYGGDLVAGGRDETSIGSASCAPYC